MVRRFGTASGEEVGLLLEAVIDWEQLAMVGEWILDAQDGAELKGPRRLVAARGATAALGPRTTVTAVVAASVFVSQGGEFRCFGNISG